MHSVILDEFHYMNDRERGTVWEVEKQKKNGKMLKKNASAAVSGRDAYVCWCMLTYADVC